MRFSLVVIVALGTVFGTGCGGEKLSDVTGTVLIDGKPLPEGEIIFESADGSKTPTAGKIANGNYSVAVAPGSKRVKITASRPPKKPDPMFGMSAHEPMLGPEFNERTTLNADIKPGKNEGVDFSVKELPK